MGSRVMITSLLLNNTASTFTLPSTSFNPLYVRLHSQTSSKLIIQCFHIRGISKQPTALDNLICYLFRVVYQICEKTATSTIPNNLDVSTETNSRSQFKRRVKSSLLFHYPTQVKCLNKCYMDYY